MAKREDLAIIRSARAGQAAAQLALGKRYLFGGNGLPQSLSTALHWLSRAAQQEESEAWMLIGSHIPLEVAINSSSPFDLCIWYERAFDAGLMEAGLVFAQLVLTSRDPGVLQALRSKAIKALETVAHSGVAEAQWLLAQHADSATSEVSDRVRIATQATGNQSEAKTEQEATLEWTSRAANAGVMQAQQSLAQIAWEKADWPVFLERALPLARALSEQYAATLAQLNVPSETLARQLGDENLALLIRTAQVLQAGEVFDAAEVQQFLELAAYGDDKGAQLALGLWFARMNSDGQRLQVGSGSANYKKAIRWLTLAGEAGLADAWYALSRIYLKSEFSQRNLVDMQRHLEHAAEMGHCAAQLECGLSAWRNRRETLTNDVRAVYWLQKAAAQGSSEAADLLAKIADSAQPAAWAEAAQRQLTREQSKAHPFLAARIELATLFGLSRPEALLLDLNLADCGHCLAVDIRSQYARSKRRLILIQTGDERQALSRIARLFEDVDCGPNGPEGNYRQRLYRFKAAVPEAAQEADSD
ncbi:sel1 repeat family protein [Collimonas arenae]|uniref:Sel1 repeat family protein n=1 Tax=Collimonas arenae TaxID=279058 RepID=A0A127QP36_9BURK|nr:tetratricopeptide repeat protein [Collimonas arenae]AMP01900.1 sel1 repeat family protein [Collimonas arenae]AMP11799.1 sel1 repeat family protein [Collimonas arenae]